MLIHLMVNRTVFYPRTQTGWHLDLLSTFIAPFETIVNIKHEIIEGIKRTSTGKAAEWRIFTLLSCCKERL